MPSTEQLDLARRLLDDDEQVLEEILHTFGPALYAVMGRRYQNVLPEADIEDALSIGLFRLWKNRHQFDPEKSSLKVWFFRIVECVIRDVLRLGWHKARLLEVRSDFALDATAVDPRRNGKAKKPTASTAPVLQRHLKEIVASLPEIQQRIILADAAARDATASSRLLADELGISASSVRVYRKRAMDRIRGELNQKGHDVP